MNTLEYFALINLCENNLDNFRLLKSIKFIRYPTITQIYKQIDITQKCIIEVCKESTHLDLELVPIN